MENVLIVDDVQEYVETLEVYLEDRFNVLKALTFKEAKLLLENTHVQLAIIDIRLDDVVDRGHGCEHGMVHVVVAVHAVAADQPEVVDAVQEVADRLKPVITPEIARICLGHADDRSVQNIGLVREADGGQFPTGQGEQITVGQAPQCLVLIAEILVCKSY